MKKRLPIVIWIASLVVLFALSLSSAFMVRHMEANRDNFDVEKEGYLQFSYQCGVERRNRCVNESLTKVMPIEPFEGVDYDTYVWKDNKLTDAAFREAEGNEDLDRITSLCTSLDPKGFHIRFMIYHDDTHYLVTHEFVELGDNGMSILLYQNNGLVKVTDRYFPGDAIISFRFLK